jgi:hypothetical protein
MKSERQEIRADPLRVSWFRKLNAAQTSHPGRIARGCPARAFTCNERMLKLTARSFSRGGRTAKVSQARRDASPGNPPAIHPRELPDTSTLLQSIAAIKTSYVCTGGTLRQERKRGNRKSVIHCAQTVDDWTSLWKAQEKWK